MASKVPISVIRQVQIALREEAGVSSYDPDDPVLLNLPSLDKVIEGFDPSPAYLRCKQCRGKLIRGLQSIVCVYCGAHQRREIPPDPIPYKSTFGYRWLLESLGLNGSEAVVLPMENSDSNKGMKVSNENLILSELFDLELKWLAGVDENESKSDSKASLQSKSSLNLSLAGVDLDNFFVETTKEFDNVPKEPRTPSIEKSIESREFPGQESLGLFGNAQSSNMAVGSGTAEGALGDTFSNWEAEFQSTSTETFAGDSKPHDPFMVRPVDHPIPVDSFFGPDTDLKFMSNVDNRTENNVVPPESVSNIWIQDDQFLKDEASNKAEKIEMDRKATYDREPKETSNNLPSTSDSWMQDDLWPSGNMKNIPGRKMNEDDPWQDFASSGNASDPFSSTWKQTSGITASPNEPASKMNLMQFDNNVQEMDFGDFVQPDLYSGASPHHNMHKNPINDRVAEVTTRDDIKSPAKDDESSVQSDSTDAVVDSLMSQMPDLSFMLESKLSIPEKKNEQDSNL